MARDLIQLEVREEVFGTPAEWEACGERRTQSAEVIADYENLSHAYRCGKQFRVAISGEEPVDILDFLYANS